MKHITIKRIFKGDSYTIGHLYINGEYFCDTLEDKDRGLTQSMAADDIRRLKVKGQTAIPSGSYDITWSYSNKFQRVMLSVNNVKGFEGIRIHSGNTPKDTEGCILLGFNRIKGKLVKSADTLKLFEKLMKDDEISTLEIE